MRWAHARAMHVSQLGCVYRIYNYHPRARICQLRKARKREANIQNIAPLIGLSAVGRQEGTRQRSYSSALPDHVSA